MQDYILRGIRRSILGKMNVSRNFRNSNLFTFELEIEK